MPQLTATVKQSHADIFGAGMQRRLRALKAADEAALQQAAQVATRATRDGFTYRRDIAPRRPGRSSSGGQMRSHLQWEVLNRGVEFDVAEADREVPHWIIQEIGTGNSAVLRKGGEANPVGRPKAGASYVRRVPSQVGRRISGGLVFASAGKYSPTRGGVNTEQLTWASRVSGVPQGAPAIRITKEIHGQHMVRDGGIKGSRQYRTSLLAAARQTFKK